MRVGAPAAPNRADPLTPFHVFPLTNSQPLWFAAIRQAFQGVAGHHFGQQIAWYVEIDGSAGFMLSNKADSFFLSFVTFTQPTTTVQTKKSTKRTPSFFMA